MCGIAGKVAAGKRVERSLIEAMGERQAHRGPDSRGVHAAEGVGLGIQRLAVIDLETGDQPIYNEDRSVVVVMNGEIYNYRELRDELRARGHRLATDGDTEVIAHLYEEFGDRCVERLAGMFAFALWDSSRHRLLIARDRVGKKPLHYFHAPAGDLSFASELAALAVDPAVPRQVDPGALDQFLAYGYIQAPKTIWTGVRKLEPGHRLVWEDGRVEVERWWRLDYSDKLSGSFTELAEQGRALIRQGVERRMISDVPLGAFLSGGIDSAIVVSEMARRSTNPVKTFSIGFDDAAYDELAGARRIAERFETDHTEFTVKPDAIELLAKLVRHYGEPYADSSAVPSFYLAELTRRQVTVALNGDGGDESFAGYRRHLINARSRGLDALPAALRRPFGRAADRLIPTGRGRSSAEYAHRLLSTVDLDAPARYASHVGIFSATERAMVASADLTPTVDQDETASVIAGPWQSATGSDRLDVILQTDVETYLPGDLLTKMDIASMAHSLEARSPLLDHEVMEFAARLPVAIKTRRMEKKWFLRQAYRGLIPDETLDGPKRGFGVPLGSWFRGELRETVREMLCGRHELAGGLVQGKAVEAIVDAHQSGASDRSAQIWALLVLDAWSQSP